MNVVVLIVIMAAILVVFGLWYVQRNRRRAELKSRFGPEYERTVETAESRVAGEKDLAEREKRVKRLQLKELDAPQMQHFTDEWKGAQGRFVDAPSGAIQEADNLVQKLMTARGYPTDDFEQQAADVSVDHPAVVNNYRAAHKISAGNAVEPASTEDLRQAMIHYRALFEELLVPSELAVVSANGTNGP
jgi:FtsZ-interacting cell division protein ZipA